ncbi:hypothetical protein ACFLQL_00360, partial [Verrucomicrobiota bacterium]
MRKFLLTLLLGLTTAISALAQTTTELGPNQILSQLGASGIASSSDGTTNYAGFIIKLGPSGVFDSSVLADMPTNIVVATLNNLYYIDAINGLDIATAGSSAQPFQTLNYAVSQLTTNSVLIFAPGAHVGSSTAITDTDITELTLVGYNASGTTISSGGTYSLTFNNSKNVTVNLVSIAVASIRQANNVFTTINGYNTASLTSFSRAYPSSAGSYATFNCDPVSSLPAITSNGTNIWSHNSTKILFVPTNTNNWEGTLPNTVSSAISNLASYPKLRLSATAGSILVWNGTNWTTDTYGTTNQMLFGGTNPTFKVLSVDGAVYGPYTNIGIKAGTINRTNIVDNAVDTNKLSTALRALLQTYLTTNTSLIGDVIGLYNSNIVVAIQQTPINAPASTNDFEIFVYDHSTTSFVYRPYIAASVVSNWAMYKASQLVDIDNQILSNVYGIILGGDYRTNWPSGEGSVTNWSSYPAQTNVDIGTNAIILGGEARTNWPVGNESGTNWSEYVSTQDVDINDNNLTNVYGMTLGEYYRTNWPVYSPSNWSEYVAIQNVDIGGFALTNILYLYFSGPYVAIGQEADASDFGVAIGNAALAVSDAVALGDRVTNTTPNSTRLKGDLFMDGAAVSGAVYYGAFYGNGVGITNIPGAGVGTWSYYVALQDVDIAGNNLTNVYGITLGGDYRTNWPSGGGAASNWSGYVATQIVDMADNGFTNVSEITLGGERITNWPSAEGVVSNWSSYIANTDVDINNKNLTNVYGMTLGGEYRTNWSTAEGVVSNWALYIANSNVDIGTNGIILGGELRTNWPSGAADVAAWAEHSANTNVDIAGFGLAGVGYIVLNGSYRTNWPTANPSNWSAYAATQTVNIANKNLTNVLGISLGGSYRTNWPTNTIDPSVWSAYPATSDIEGSNYSLIISNINLGGVSRDTWPWIPNDTNVINNIFYIGSTATDVGMLYQLTTNDTWEKVINTSATNCAGLLGIALGAGSDNGMLVRGLYETSDTNLVSGEAIYVSPTLGTWTNTIPTNEGYVIRQVGYITDTNQILIEPDGTYIVLGPYVDVNYSYHYIAPQYFDTVVASNFVSLTTNELYGTTAGGLFTNTVIFDTEFTNTPRVFVTWNDDTIDQIA